MTRPTASARRPLENPLNIPYAIRGSTGSRRTKGKRFRSVQISPRLVATLQHLRDERATTPRGDGGWLFLCRPPLRGRYSAHRIRPPNRRPRTIGHEWALEDAGPWDMPLYARPATAQHLHSALSSPRRAGSRGLAKGRGRDQCLRL